MEEKPPTPPDTEVVCERTVVPEQADAQTNITLVVSSKILFLE